MFNFNIVTYCVVWSIESNGIACAVELLATGDCGCDETDDDFNIPCNDPDYHFIAVMDTGH